MAAGGSIDEQQWAVKFAVSIRDHPEHHFDTHNLSNPYQAEHAH
jgi:hypothetical protein